MPTDLTTAPDHPATLIRKWASERPNANADDSLTRLSMSEAAGGLNTYEAVRGVTFAALDNDALAAVREAFEATTGDLETYSSNLADAVRDLLGLAD